MAGYTPLFGSLFQGSLCGKFPDLYVWMVMLGLADKHGEVDCHPSYIATVSGIGVDLVEQAISRLCAPDQYSRTQSDDGRRLIPLPNRGFGWSIVNHAKYREIARLADKSQREVENGSNAARMRGRRDQTRPDETAADPQGPPETAGDRRRPPLTPSHTHTHTHTQTKSKSARKRASRVPEDFSPDTDFALLEIPDLDVTAEVQKFREWEFARPKSDWSLTWKRWIRTCKETGRYARIATPPKETTNGLPVLRFG